MITRLQDYYTSFKKVNAGLVLVVAVMSLTLLGLVVLASASLSFSHNATPIFTKQLIWLFGAIVAGLVAAFIDLEKARSYAWYFAGFSFLLLLLVLVPGLGVRVNGAQRWLGLGPVRLQVAEVAKLGLVFALAHYVAINQRHLKTFVKGFLVPAAAIGAFCFLILLQPDFGTAFLCGCVGFGVLFLSGTRIRYLFPSILGAIVLFSIAIMLDPVRLRRLTSFLDIEANKSDGAYQLWQGILAFAAGGVNGVGLGNGRQQMAFLPEAHTDFIFPIIGEELGLLFTAGVVLLFFIIFVTGVIILRQAPNLFYFALIAGSLMCIVLQAIINMGVVLGILPTKGMSLPFISYGGSNLVLMFSLVGILCNCFRTWSTAPLIKVKEL